MALTRINNNSLSAVTSAGIPGHGSLTEVDQWYLQADHTTNNTIANWGRSTYTGFSTLGTGMTVSSGVWTFPSTGYWQVDTNIMLESVSGDQATVLFEVRIDGTGTYVARTDQYSSGTGLITSPAKSIVLDVYSTDSVKLALVANSLSTNSRIQGDDPMHRSWVKFIRLGDT